VLLHVASHLKHANDLWQGCCITFRQLAIGMAASEAATTVQQRQVAQRFGALQHAESTVQSQLPAICPERTWGFLKENVRVMVSVLAFAFGAAARRPGATTHSLWTRLARGWTKGLKTRQITARERRHARESSENATRLLARQEQSRKAWKIDQERKRKAEAKQRQQGR
jgi:hypothetical protein